MNDPNTTLYDILKDHVEHPIDILQFDAPQSVGLICHLCDQQVLLDTSIMDVIGLPGEPDE